MLSRSGSGRCCERGNWIIGAVPNYCFQRLSPNLDLNDGSLSQLTPTNVFVVLGNFTNVKVITDWYFYNTFLVFD